MVHKNLGQKLLFTLLILFFIAFLILPIVVLISRAFIFEQNISLQHIQTILSDSEIIQAMFNSIKVSLLAAIITTILAFTIAYTIHITMVNKWVKFFCNTLILIPMLIPTITYGFVLIYTFGNEGILARVFGEAPFTIYGRNGLLMGYVIYTLPIVFVVISNAFNYIDKRFCYISELMGDKPFRTFYHTIARPMFVPVMGAFVLSFILSFTDFGIPASLSADYPVIALSLYQAMLGSLPKFGEGAAIAIIMLIPALLGFILLTVIERFNVEHSSQKYVELKKRKFHDYAFGSVSICIVTFIALLFLVMFIIPFTKGYPYDLTFTFSHLVQLFKDDILIRTYLQSLFVAFGTAIFGVLISFTSALISVRTNVKGRQSLNLLSIVTNTVPGMVLGLSYLLLFNNSSLKGTLLIIILSNIVHYFTTPYLMAKGALEKLDMSWDVTSTLLEDTWLQTIFRIILPNMKSTIINIFQYYFVNAMVTISGVIFLITSSTMLVSTQINVLQHFNAFNDIFLLSIFIFVTNLVIKMICTFSLEYLKRKEVS